MSSFFKKNKFNGIVFLKSFKMVPLPLQEGYLHSSYACYFTLVLSFRFALKCSETSSI